MWLVLALCCSLILELKSAYNCGVVTISLAVAFGRLRTMFGCCKYNIKFAESCERLEEETRRLSTICEVKFALSLFPSLPHFLCFESDGVLTEANPRQSFSSSVAETEKTEEEDDGGEDIVAISSHRLWFSVYSSRWEVAAVYVNIFDPFLLSGLFLKNIITSFSGWRRRHIQQMLAVGFFCCKLFRFLCC